MKGKFYNEDYAKATIGFPHIDKYFNLREMPTVMPNHQKIKESWEKFTIEELAAFEKLQLPQYENTVAESIEDYNFTPQEHEQQESLKSRSSLN